MFSWVVNHFEHLFCFNKKYFIKLLIFFLQHDTSKIKKLAKKMRVHNTINIIFYSYIQIMVHFSSL